MPPILVVLPYCQKDAALAKELVSWMAELKMPRAAAILLAADNTVPRETINEISDIAKQTFNFAKTMLIPITPGGWAPNKMFLSVANQIKEQYRWPFFWMEPDCIPLKGSWLEELENAYNECPKRFLGSLVHQESNPALPKVHLNGVAIYPPDAIDSYESNADISSGKQTWDIGSAATVVPKSAHTHLIFHFWGMPDLPPTFVEKKVSGQSYPENCFELSRIPSDAVVMHRNKDGSLIKAVRSALANIRTQALEEDLARSIPLTVSPKQPAPAPLKK